LSCRCLFFIFLIPEFLTFLRSARFVLLKSVRKPHWSDIAIVATMESFHTAGLALLFFGALPNMDSTMALVVSGGGACIPALLKLVGNRNEPEWKRAITLSLDAMAFVVQVAVPAFFAVANLGWDGDNRFFEHGWTLPVGLILASFGWWESFASDRAYKPFKSLSYYLFRVKRDMFEKNTR